MPEDKAPGSESIRDRWPLSRFFDSGNIAALIALTFVCALCVIAVLAPFIAPYDPYQPNLANVMVPPVWFGGGAWSHPLGTDSLGRDYLSRLIFGARISLLVGFVATFISGLIGITLGLLAGYFGGKVDSIVSFLISVRLGMPVALAALAVVSVAGGSLTIIVVVLSLLLWDRFALVARGLAKQIREQEFVVSAQALGCHPLRVMITEILPNMRTALVVVATLEVANAILLESALSFLGMGVKPPVPSWGLMIAEAKQDLLFDAWLMFIPGTALLFLLLAVNVVGDSVSQYRPQGGRVK